MDKKGSIVAVGVSGGVDSSVAAYLLKEQGYDVIGIFVKTWSPEWLPCTWVAEKRDAMRVCAALDIPFYSLDATEEYKAGVADYMIGEYRAGRTPNPDVLCNRVIKFGALWKYAQSLGATMIATGHYAQVRGGRLLKGNDESKDQSYFLWMLEKDELAHVMFPIGNLPKSEVRAIAAKANLMTAAKKDSQGICFLGDVDMREFLSHYIDEKPGDVVTEEGVVIGSHDGVWFYTLGERHGFTITEHSTERKPYYVVGKDIRKNQLIVAHERTEGKTGSHVVVTLRDANWQRKSDMQKQCAAQLRYHGGLIPADILSQHSVRLTHDGVIALGQSLVIYEGDVLLGGGVIDAVMSEE